MPNTFAPKASALRQRIIIRTSAIGIMTNLLLSGFKAAVGLVSGSIAIVLDAVNNLSDALSSIVTIIGVWLAGRPADRAHPLGHGRIEYLSSLAVSILILYAGLTSLVQSIRAIVNGDPPHYSALSLIIVGAAIIVKLLLGRYMYSVGKRVNSDSLVGSGRDSLNDAIISGSTLAAAVIMMIWGVSIEGWLGIVISLLIFKSGYELIRGTLRQILGGRVDGEMPRQVKASACRTRHVLGAYDLVLHNYGPDRFIGSLHVEIPDTLSAEEIDMMEREVANNVFQDTGVIITAVGVYSRNTQNNQAAMLRTEITRCVASHDHVLQVHGFHLDESRKTIHFDVVVDFAVPDRDALFRQIVSEVEKLHPEYTFQVTLDSDITG